MAKIFRNKIIKIGAYIIFSLGIIISLALLILGVSLFFVIPEASLQKKVIVSLLIILLSGVMFMAFLSLFETMIEIVEIETKSEIGEDGRAD